MESQAGEKEGRLNMTNTTTICCYSPKLGLRGVCTEIKSAANLHGCERVKRQSMKGSDAGTEVLCTRRSVEIEEDTGTESLGLWYSDIKLAEV